MNDIPEGLIVITGDNESGKTTTMEFMRRTMFPVTKRKGVYPTPYDSDRGSLELETSSGTTVVLERDGKKVTGRPGEPLPSEMFSMDPDAYRSIFAMDLTDLVRSEGMDDLRRRFLTIPGGEAVPQIIDNIRKPKEALMNEDRFTGNKRLNVINERISELNEGIRSAEEFNSEYDNYSKKLRELESERDMLLEASGDVKEKNLRYNILNAQSRNIETYFELAKTADATKYSESVTDEMISVFDEALKKKKELERSLEKCTVEVPSDEGIEEMRSLDRRVNDVTNDVAKTERIGAVKRSLSSLDGQVKAMEEMPPTPVRTAPPKNGLPVPYLVAVILGIVTAVVGIAMSQILVVGAGATVAAVGVILTLTAGKRNTSNVPATVSNRSVETAGLRERIRELSEELEGLESESLSLQRDLEKFITGAGAEYRGFAPAVRILSAMINDAEERSRKAAERKEMTDEVDSLDRRLKSITEPYGGTGGFAKACTDRRTFNDTVRNMRSLRGSVEAAVGMSLEDAQGELLIAVPPEDPVAVLDHSEEIGGLKNAMENIISGNDLSMKQTELNARKAEFRDVAREWAVLAMQGTLIDRSCTELYSKMQPSVLRTADRYLGIMTGGRYTLISDPRLNDMTIRDNHGIKRDGEWSSGLRDQVYLSLKMAIAKEMGSERLPMILDDVLVRFDGTRRKGACAAISEFAKDQQVFLFSCDSSLPDDMPGYARFDMVRLNGTAVTDTRGPPGQE